MESATMNAHSDKCTCEMRYPSPKCLRDIDYGTLLERIKKDPALLKPIKCPGFCTVYGFDEHFFRCVECRSLWVWMEPDGAYGGSWGIYEVTLFEKIREVVKTRWWAIVIVGVLIAFLVVVVKKAISG
jgi:hypothetical protein